ncbi:RWD domain-containing protein 4 [Atheta coriaria]|uniref:RWD domain-containing protein 4 n=1 Tax=Dalotia coriaria TaxID=877792 RepID=UPI0031F343DC
MSNLELQEEEREVLNSIYDGDDCYKQIDPTTHQYKYGINDDPKSFVLELKWNDTYPETKPEICMDAFYNKHIIQSLKDKICSLLSEEAEQYLGMSMTYSLFEFIKEKFDELIQEQPEHVVNESVVCDVDKMTINDPQESKKEQKKEQLTKAQKRRQWDRVDGKGEKPRGWNWVDIVRHLSQTGGKDEIPPT